MRIVIVGAGIAGLTTYLFLKKFLSPIDVQLEIVKYEKYHAAATSDSLKRGGPTSRSTTAGAALGIAPNGLQVLRDLDDQLFQSVVAQDYSISHFGMHNSHGWILARCPATNFGNPPMLTVLISRQRFWASCEDMCRRTHLCILV